MNTDIKMLSGKTKNAVQKQLDILCEKYEIKRIINVSDSNLFMISVIYGSKNNEN